MPIVSVPRYMLNLHSQDVISAAQARRQARMPLNRARKNLLRIIQAGFEEPRPSEKRNAEDLTIVKREGITRLACPQFNGEKHAKTAEQYNDWLRQRGHPVRF